MMARKVAEVAARREKIIHDVIQRGVAYAREQRITVDSDVATCIQNELREACIRMAIVKD